MTASRRGTRPAADRAVVTLAYFGSVVAVGLVPALFFEPGQQGCSACAGNLVAVANAHEVVNASMRAGVSLGVIWSAALVLVALRRLLTAPATARQATAPLLVPLIGYLLAVGLAYVHAAGDGELLVDQTAQRLWSVQAVALCVLSLGFVALAVRARRARRHVARAVIALAQSPRPGDLRATLARTLDDPDLQIAYPLSDGRYHDDSGSPIDVTPASDYAM